MEWIDCPLIEQVPGKLSGAPVLRHSRVRPNDLIVNIAEGPEWLAEAFVLPLEDVKAVLAFHDRHGDALPTGFISSERREAMTHADPL